MKTRVGRPGSGGSNGRMPGVRFTRTPRDESPPKLRKVGRSPPPQPAIVEIAARVATHAAIGTLPDCHIKTLQASKGGPLYPRRNDSLFMIGTRPGST